MSRRRREAPLRRINPSGRKVFVARWTDRHGKRRSAGTFDLQREAQDAIDAAYDAHYNATPGPQHRYTVGDYADRWTDRHPRSPRTTAAYESRLRAVLDVKLSGVAFRAWPMQDVRPREVTDLIDHMLRKQCRAHRGVTAILTTMSAMWKDGIRDDVTHYNPWRDAPVRATDPRIVKAPRRLRVYTFEQMHTFAAAAPGVYGQAMIRLLADAGLRIGEMLPVERADLRLNGCADPECRAGHVPHVHIVRTAFEGAVTGGTKNDRGEAVPGRVAPVAAGLEAILRGLPPRLDTRLLFPAHRGGVLQNHRFYEKVWQPAREVTGMLEATPHEFRHTWVSRMRAAGIDVADLAAAAGHTVETATKVYTHPLGRSFEAMREAVGE